MFKKVLYVILVVMLGSIIFLMCWSSFASNSIKKAISGAIKDKNYSIIEKYYTFTFVDDANKEFASDVEEGAHVEVFSCITAYQHFKLEEGAETPTEDSTTLNNAIQVALFTLPESFKIGDNEGAKGGITVTYSDATTSFFSFDSIKADPTAPNYYVNYYEYYQYYQFMYINLFESDFATLKPEFIDGTVTLDSMQISDGTGTVKYSFDFVTKPSFQNTFHTEMRPYTVTYNTYVENADQDNANKSLTDTVKYADSKGFNTEYSSSVIYKSAAFLVPFLAVVIGYIGLAIFLGILFFRRRRSSGFTYHPAHEPKNQPAPIPFTREDFSGEKVEEAPEGYVPVEDPKTDAEETSENEVVEAEIEEKEE